MDLREYLFRNRMTATQLAKKTDTSLQYILRIKNGHHHPSLELALKIVIESHGQVTLKELRPNTVKQDKIMMSYCLELGTKEKEKKDKKNQKNKLEMGIAQESS